MLKDDMQPLPTEDDVRRWFHRQALGGMAGDWIRDGAELWNRTSWTWGRMGDGQRASALQRSVLLCCAAYMSCAGTLHDGTFPRCFTCGRLRAAAPSIAEATFYDRDTGELRHLGPEPVEPPDGDAFEAQLADTPVGRWPR